MKEFLPMLQAVAESGKPLLISQKMSKEKPLQRSSSTNPSWLKSLRSKSSRLWRPTKSYTPRHCNAHRRHNSSAKRSESNSKLSPSKCSAESKKPSSAKRRQPSSKALATKKRSQRELHSSRQIEESTSDYDREKLQERLAKLAGGVGIIRVGAATEIEMKEKKDRVDDAVHATKAAVEEGILPGGGVALIRSIPALEALKASLAGDEKLGIEILIKAISYPLRQIAENAGKEGSIIVQKVSQMRTLEGWDAQSDTFGNMLKMGIVDPTKVVRLCIELSASIAALLLTTEAIISEEADEKSSTPSMSGAEY